LAVSSIGILASLVALDRATGARDAPAWVAGYPVGATLMETIHIDDPGTARNDLDVIPEAKAIELATESAGRLADPSKPMSVQLAIVTNDTYGRVDEFGDVVEKFVDHELCWLIRFTGTPQPAYGGRRVDGSAMADGSPAATELNVVVDAHTGEILMMFSFQ
jgi:hypothetical protein